MSDESKTLDVTIMGKTYRVTCAPDEEKDLLAAVDFVDNRMSEIREGGRTMAQINCHIENTAFEAADYLNFRMRRILKVNPPNGPNAVSGRVINLHNQPWVDNYL